MTTRDSSTPLGRVRGLGSSKHGGGHWIRERLTSVALLLLSAWLLASLVLLPDLEQRTLVEWLRAPLGFVPMALFVIVAFVHTLDGLRVVIDDYVHDEGNRLLSHGLLTFLVYGGGAFALYSLVRIAFGGAA
jgi:succinate dehydrogenase / fumarate reductase, membrane anchor subunit